MRDDNVLDQGGRGRDLERCQDWEYITEPKGFLMDWMRVWKTKAVQFSLTVVSSYLWPHGQQRTRPPCPSPPPRVYPNSCPLSQWCYPAITSSVVPFSSRLQSFPASASFQMNQFFALGGQSIGVSASTSFLPKNIQDWFLQDGLVGSPCSPRDSQESFPTPQFKSINSSVLSFLRVQLSHPYMTTGKTIALTRQTFVDKVMSLFLICSLVWS